MKLKITCKKNHKMVPPAKIPAKCKHAAVEFIVDPSIDGESLASEIFETVIIPISVYRNIYNQLLRAEKIKVLYGARQKEITAKDFYTALKNRHEKYDKAIGYHSFF